MSFLILVMAHLGIGEFRWEQAPVNYSDSTADNVVVRLQERIDNGEVRLPYDETLGYLPSILRALEIPAESQGLVFSKTSLQTSYISPRSPRAIYYSDDVYVGSVPGAPLIELSVHDPKLGAVFYTIRQRKVDTPEFVREGAKCLQCHASSKTRDFPGHLVRSVFPDADGLPIFKAGTFLTTHESPMEERWGGWYVTGRHGAMRHMGNVTAVETEFGATLDSESGANRMTVSAAFDRERYLSEHSDIVALMVLEHQTQMHNLLIRANFETRFALADQATMDEILERDGSELRESTLRRIKNTGERLIRYMFFTDEAPLEGPIVGSSTFFDVFSALGPNDDQGRSLREFDLNARLMKYPLSYMIYSNAFKSLPHEVKSYALQRIRTILTADSPVEGFEYLSDEVRSSIHSILEDTLEEY